MQRRSWVGGEKGVAVEITRDGDFRFVLGVVNTKKKGSVKRSIVLWFRDPLGPPGDPNLRPPDPDSEPLNGVWFRTLFFAGGNPELNFRMMKPGDVEKVRLHFPFSTTERNGFWLRFDPDDDRNSPDGSTGIVQVTACPAPLVSQPEIVDACLGTDSDGLVDRWVLVPVPDTDSKVNLVRREDGIRFDFGDFRMPFLLTLDRQY